MEIKFYYNQSDERAINKTIVNETEFLGEIRGSANIMSPTIRFQDSDVIRYNYCYIPDFQRYYFVTSVTAIAPNVYDIQFTVDVLMSFRGDIVQLPCIISRQSMTTNGDEYIDDGSFITDNLMFTTAYEYPGGFNSTPEFILITAG